MDLTIDPSLRDLLPPASGTAVEELERQIVACGGPQDPLVVWKETGFLLDGHRRYINGMSPEHAALAGLIPELATAVGVIDAEQYMNRYRLPGEIDGPPLR